MSASRVVAFVVTPLLAAVSGAAVSVGAKFGLHLTSAEVTADGLAIATAVTSLGLKWLHGSSLFEREYANIKHYVDLAAVKADTVDPGVVAKVEAAAVTEAKAAEAKLVAVVAGPPADTPAPPAPVPVVALVPPADPNVPPAA